MRVITISLIVVFMAASIFVIYNFYNPPRPKMMLSLPVHTLERLGYNDGDLSLMLSDSDSCENEFSEHNYAVMFDHEANWKDERKDVRLWQQYVTLYPTWPEIFQITEEINLCIRFKNEWEVVWKGSFSLKGTLDLYVAYNRFFCNRNNLSSKWECNNYEPYIDEDNKEEIYQLLTKYDEETVQ